MTSSQKYIIIILVALLGVFLLSNRTPKTNLPQSIGDPLELIVVKNTNDLGHDFFNNLKGILTTTIGPSPQPEVALSLVEVENEQFRGILKRHQNLLIVSKSDRFDIKITSNVFSDNQLVIFLSSSSNKELTNNKEKVFRLVEKIKKTEIDRIKKKINTRLNLELTKQIKSTHNISLSIPQDFFLAHSEPGKTWVRRETKKISQGIFLFDAKRAFPEATQAADVISAVETSIKNHILGPAKNSYMALEREAPIKETNFRMGIYSGLKIQSLWKMENDFMGGICNIYYFNSKNLKSPLIVYTYLYAPGESKKIPLLQLDAIISTIK